MAHSSRAASPLLLFDTSADGHHPEYVQHVVGGIAERQWPGDVVLAAPEAMLAARPDLTAGGVRTVSLSALPHPPNPWADAKAQWALLSDVVGSVRPARVLLFYGDAFVPALARHARLPGHPTLSTLHFRAPVRERGQRLRERVRDIVKRHQLNAALCHPDLRSAFVLDPRALPTFRARANGAETAVLADPVAQVRLSPDEQAAARHRVRQGLGVGADRHLMVLFGSLEPRKGLFETLRAVQLLPAAAAERLAVAFVGPLWSGCRAAFSGALAVAAQATPALLILRDHTVAQADIPPLLVAADTVLLPYQRHLGSSAVLIRAAGLARPTVTQDVGLVGDWAREHRLGRAVDSTDPVALARVMQDALDDPLGGFDPASARAFAAGHTPEAFARTLLDGPGGLLA